MKPTPPGWPRISSGVWYQDPAKAIDWLCDAFGFEVRLKIETEDGDIAHSELVFGDGVIMIGGQKYEHRRSPRAVAGANTQSMMVYVDDVDAHFKRAREAGAKIVSELTTTDQGEEYGSNRGYEAEDLEGHHWWFFQRLRDPMTK